MKKLLAISFLALMAFLWKKPPYFGGYMYFTAADGTVMVTYDTTLKGTGTSTVWNARITRPADWWERTDSTEGVLNINGLGEVGTDTTFLVTYGPHAFLKPTGSWDGTVSLSSGDHHPIFITLQPNTSWPAEVSTNYKVDAILSKFRIKAHAVHAMGLSMGAWSWMTYVTGDALGGPYNYARKITSIVNIEGAKPNANTPYPQLFSNWSNSGQTANMLGFEQYNDGSRDVLTIVNQLNSAHSGSYYIRTKIGTLDHCCFNSFYDPSANNWSSSNAVVYSTTPTGGIQNGLNIYQWALLQGDTTGGGGSTPPPVNQNPTANANSDQSITLPTSSVTLSGSGSDADGTVASHVWSFVSGPVTPVITTPSSYTSTVTGLTQAGTYTLRLTVTDDDGATGTDDMKITVSDAAGARDYMTKNVNPCRAGAGQKFTVGNSIISGKVTTTEIYFPYVNRDNLFSSQVQGGDTIVIVANPNNGGYWKNVELGGFGGNASCPVIVMADSIVKITDNFRIGIRDSNVVAYTHINGLANRTTKGVTYGFQNADQTGTQDISNIGFTANLVHHLEVDGLYIKNSEVGMMIKLNGDSTNLFKQYPNFRLQNINVHDIYLKDIHGEAMYLGNTDIDGTAQTANQGTKPPDGDTLTVNRVIINNAGWDGVQVSNFNYGNEVKNVVAYKTGNRNQSSQQWSVFIGGNTQGLLHDVVAVNATGPLGVLGKGTSSIYNNLIDSVNNGKTDADGIYVSMSTSGMTQPFDSLICNTYSNVISRVVRNAVFHANTSNAMKAGTIHDNIYAGSSGTFTTNASDVLTNNTSNSTYNIPSSFSDNDVYKTFVLVKNYPDSMVSFYDAAAVNQLPIVDAGADQAIATTTAIVLGAANDPDGTIQSHEWTLVSGPNTPVITDASAYGTSFTNLISGTYVFRLTAVDNNGASSSDDIQITVNPVPNRTIIQDIYLKKVNQTSQIPMNNILTIAGIALSMTAQSQSVATLRSTTSPNTSTLYYVGEQKRFFYYDAADDTTQDDLGSCIVSSNGKRFKPLEQTGQILPEHFGAKGDGVTDDTSPMQKAINYCSKIMGQIYLGGKTYVVSTDTLKNNTSITGPGSIKHKTGSQWAIFYYPQVSPRGVPLENVSFNNVNFYGEKSPATDNWQSAIDIYYGKNIKINNVFARDFRASAFHLTDVSNVWINNIDLHNIGRPSGSNAVDIITSSTITPNDPTATQKIFIDKVSIDTCYTAGINVVGKIDSISTKVSITNCTVNYCPNFAGIALEAGSAVQNIVSTCQMYNCKTGFSSIITGNGGTVDRMRQNIFSDNIIDSRDMPNAQGIDIQGHNWNVCNNIIKSSGAAATIRGYNGIKSKNTIFSNNNITVSGDAVNLPFGVMVQDCTAPSVTNNVAESENQYTKDAFYISDCDNVKANSNTAKGFGRNAFNIINVNVGLLNGNTVINPNSNNASGSGISISGTSADVSLVGNDIRDNRGGSKLMQYGIICSATTRNSAMNNVVYGGVNGIDATNLIVDGNIIDGVLN